MRWRAQAKGAQQMAKLRLLLFCAYAEGFEHFRLQLRLMNADAAAADFDSVSDYVVGIGAHFAEFFLLKQRKIFGFRSGEGMMDRVPFIFLGAPLHQRKICHPEKVQVRAGLAFNRSQTLDFRYAQSDSSEHFAGDLPFSGGEENTIAFLDM